mmetsp:Transcript_1/g.4  ORF Transcript_1/g.4 Transcript_1/m.4 type:complete len:143 (-) Transcript_1:51-479(-)
MLTHFISYSRELSLSFEEALTFERKFDRFHNNRRRNRTPHAKHDIMHDLASLASKCFVRMALLLAPAYRRSAVETGIVPIPPDARPPQHPPPSPRPSPNLRDRRTSTQAQRGGRKEAGKGKGRRRKLKKGRGGEGWRGGKGN